MSPTTCAVKSAPNAWVKSSCMSKAGWEQREAQGKGGLSQEVVSVLLYVGPIDPKP